MRVRVLGAAAGGGLPQWNCGCPNCADARAGSPAVIRQMQSSIAVSADGERWVLFNASPEVRAQIEASPALQPRDGVRGSPIEAVFLTDAEVDHTTGLLLLREGRRLTLYCTAFVARALRQSGVLTTLESYLDLSCREVVPGAPIRLRGFDGEEVGLEVEAFGVPGDPPLYYREDEKAVDGGAGRPGDATGEWAPGSPAARTNPSEAPDGVTVGTRVRSIDAGAALVYVPGAGAVDPEMTGRVGARDTLLWDGTFWTDDELVRLGISDRRAADMSHLPISGPEGSLERFRSVRARRKAYIHINNTNPIVRLGSPERRAVEAAGWEVACDGMEFDI